MQHNYVTPSFHANNHLGSISELVVAAELIKRGCEIFSPLVNGSEIDLIAVLPNGAVARLQIKSARSHGKESSKRSIHTKRENKRGGTMKAYTRIDFFVACAGADVWVFPATECQGSVKQCGQGSTAKNAWHLILGQETPVVPLRIVDHPPSLFEAS